MLQLDAEERNTYRSDNMSVKFNNPLFRMIHERPLLSFFATPIIINLGAQWLSATIRKGKTGSYFKGVGNVFEQQDEISPMAGLGNIRSEGGDNSDLMFRATISNRETGPGATEYDEVQARPTGAPVRYDREYHDSIFFPNLDYKENKQVVSQSFPAKAVDTYVFAGINGINKINMR